MDKFEPVIMGVYGTLRKGFGNHRYLEGAKFLGTGRTVDKFVLQQHGIPYVSRKKVGIAPWKGSNVVIEVYEVESAWRLDNIDSLEGHPRWYVREPIPIKMENGEIVQAEVYLNEGSNAPENLSGDYKTPIFIDEV